MFSPELMRFLINYQTPEYNKNIEKQTKNFHFGLKNRTLAKVFLADRK